ncbi:MAG: polyamine aminopropyltransferase [Chitinispirillaceae bacterium]|nr:polyamine aminopropyltransferase [Chitinispirillaceae bacterium]
MNKMSGNPAGIGTSLWLNNLVHGLAGVTIKVKHPVLSASSRFQKIEVFDTYRYGMVLCLGGSVVMTEHDGDIYHEMIVHPPLVCHKKPAHVCIIGGGDGGCLTQALKHAAVESIVIVEIDKLVREAVQKHFPALAEGFSDKRVSMVIDDGYNFLSTTDRAFDVVIVDSYDPGGPVQSLETADFHHVAASRLKADGIAVIQTDSPVVRPDFLRQTLSLISPLFAQAKPYFCTFSSFPESICSFILCGRKEKQLDLFDEQRAAKIAATCVYYNGDIHRGAFLLPQFLKKIIREIKQ